MALANNFNPVFDGVPPRNMSRTVAQRSLLNPLSPATATEPLYLLDGEFVAYNAEQKMAREGLNSSAAGGLSTADPSAANSVSKLIWYPVWIEPGAPDGQVTGKITVIRAAIEADFSSQVISADSFAAGDLVYINWLVNGSNINRRRGISKTLHASDAATARAHGYVVRVYTSGPFALRVALFGF